MADPQVSLVEDFWLAVARNDRAGAEAAAASIEVPLVALAPAYSFELVEDEVPGGEDEQEDTARGEEGREYFVRTGNSYKRCRKTKDSVRAG